MSEQTQNRQSQTAEPASSVQPGVNMGRSPDTGRSLGQILIVLVVLLVLVNIPINYYGDGLAHITPNTTPIIIQDGLLLRGNGSEIYILEDHKLRRITNLEAFYPLFKPDKIRLVEDSLLEQFGQGQPVRRLLKCRNSPCVYTLENGQKRRVKEPFAANKAKPWNRVHLVSCDYLNNLPDGSPISEKEN